MATEQSGWVGRRLRDVSRAVGETVSGVLGVRLGEGPDEPVGPAAAGAQTEGEPDPQTVDPDPEDLAVTEHRPTDETDPAVAPVAAGGDPAPAAETPVVPVLQPTAEAVAALPEPAAGPPAETIAEPPAEAAAEPPAETPAADEPGPEEVPRTPDAVLAAAVDLAREVAADVAEGTLGEHLGVEAEGPSDAGPAVAHLFATTAPAYRGWRWVVTLARAEGEEKVTVDEVALLPGADAVLAPAWLPWNERVRADDLGAGDLLPPPADDPRLVPAYADPATDLDAALAGAVRWELGLGRPRVLSREGRELAAERWWEGEQGPDSDRAKQAPGRCDGCGFLVPLAGALAQAFGVCANAVAPDDGRVVALTHGCGAHSETVVPVQHAVAAGMAVEDDELELVPSGAGDA